MNDYTLENFISYCDDMQIAEESTSSTQLTDNQKSEICNDLNATYSSQMITIFKKVINKFPKLKNSSMYYIDNSTFRYDNYADMFYGRITDFGNYAFEKMTTSKKDMTSDEMISELNNFNKDIKSLKTVLQSAIKNFNGMTIVLEDDEGRDLDEFIAFISSIITQYGEVPSNSITLYLAAPKSKYSQLIPSESQIKEREQKRYLSLYEQFIKFLKTPNKLNSTFWGGSLADICKIIGISSNELNSIVSKNIRPFGTKKRIDGNSFSNDTDYGKQISRELGECLVIESGDGEEIVYSINKKKIYYLSYEHTECSIFYNDYPYNSKEFENIIYDNNELKSEVKALFKEYNKKNNITLFKIK